MVIRIKVIKNQYQYNLKNREIFLYNENGGDAGNAELELGAPRYSQTQKEESILNSREKCYISRHINS